MPRCVDWFSLFTTALCNKVEFYADASFGKLEALLGQAASGERQAALDRREKVPEDLEDVGPPSGSKVVREREWGGRSGTPPVSRAAAEKVMRDAGSRRSGSGTGTPRAASPAFGHAASALSTIHPNSGYSGNLNLLGGEGARNSGYGGPPPSPSAATKTALAGLRLRAILNRKLYIS
ncbi:hypothetical protein T492DRAFT_424264 [Pavlovales sp. CCMP2436]|nr:hypothetical protein T492DRAFT_424264 [Pavlovales sp. CCMP2436]